jgi:hypothetical protein
MNRGLVIALAATLVAVWYVSGMDEAESPEGAAPVAHARRAATPAPGMPANTDAGVAGAPVASAPVHAAAEIGRDLFASHSFLPPPPKPVARVGPPPAPMAPPLPFRYQGRMTEEGATTVFLAQGERILVARAGDLLNNQYRVESVTTGAVTFMYEPLKQRQTLTLGSAK